MLVAASGGMGSPALTLVGLVLMGTTATLGFRTGVVAVAMAILALAAGDAETAKYSKEG